MIFTTKEKIQLPVNCNIAEEVEKLMMRIQEDMLAKATAKRDSMTYNASTLEEFEKIMNATPGFVRADWCGCTECEEKIKGIRGTKSRCILENEKLITGKCVCCGKPAQHHVVWGIQY